MKTFSEFRTNVYHDDPEVIAICTLWESGRKNATKTALDTWEEFEHESFPMDLLEGYYDWLESKQRKVSRVMKECEIKNVEFLSVLKNPEFYSDRLVLLDEYMIRDLGVHGWDLYIESLNIKQK